MTSLKTAAKETTRPRALEIFMGRKFSGWIFGGLNFGPGVFGGICLKPYGFFLGGGGLIFMACDPRQNSWFEF